MEKDCHVVVAAPACEDFRVVESALAGFSVKCRARQFTSCKAVSQYVWARVADRGTGYPQCAYSPAAGTGPVQVRACASLLRISRVSTQ